MNFKRNLILTCSLLSLTIFSGNVSAQINQSKEYSAQEFISTVKKSVKIKGKVRINGVLNEEVRSNSGFFGFGKYVQLSLDAGNKSKIYVKINGKNTDSDISFSFGEKSRFECIDTWVSVFGVDGNMRELDNCRLLRPWE